MGFLDKLLRGGDDERRPAAGRDAAVSEHLRGPEPGALLTPADIEAATGSAPVGEGDRRSGGFETDVGFFRVCIWQLLDGGELIVNSTRIRDGEAESLWRTRWDDPSWQNGSSTKPIEGVGDAARWSVKKASKKKLPGGGTELHVDAKQGHYSTSFVHTSPSGTRDPGPLTALTVLLLERLQTSR